MTRTIRPCTPGEVLQDVLNDLDRDSNWLASKTGMHPLIAAGVINGSVRVTREVAEQLDRAFGSGPSLWLRLQNKLDEWQSHAPETP